jgi:hypothetical protein
LNSAPKWRSRETLRAVFFPARSYPFVSKDSISTPEFIGTWVAPSSPALEVEDAPMNRESVEHEILSLAARSGRGMHGCAVEGLRAILHDHGAPADLADRVLEDLVARDLVTLRHGSTQAALTAEGRSRLRALDDERRLFLRVPTALFEELAALARHAGSTEAVALLALKEWVRFQKMTRRFASPVPPETFARVA